MIRYLLLITMLLMALSNKATHIVGGEITYKHLGNDSFEIKLDLYIDCINGSASAISSDQSSMLAFFDTSGVLNSSLMVSRNLPQRISSVNYNCVIPPTNACVDKYSYVFYKRLPPIPGGYIMAFQRCCRNNSINNIINPAASGATYWAAIKDTFQSMGYNNSAVFRSLPPNFVCNQRNFTFDHSATDVDGDSLSYSLYTPYLGASSGIPRPLPPAGPPYDGIGWLPPYSETQMMSGNPELAIHPVTGRLTVKPAVTGQFVVGIAAHEYRKGRLINTVRRDYQFNVLNCIFTTVSALNMNVTLCNDTVKFINNSEGSESYLWEFGNPLVTNDTSRSFEPTYIYPGPGKYTVKLHATKGNCTDTSEAIIELLLDTARFAGPDTTLCFGEQLRLGNAATGFSYNWTPSSYLNNPISPQPIAKPEATIRYIVTRKNKVCNNTDTIDIKLIKPVASASDIITCSDTAIFVNNSSGATRYLWNFGDDKTLSDTSNWLSPTYVYSGGGIYKAVLFAWNERCVSTDTINADIQGMFRGFGGIDTSICTGEHVKLGNTDTGFVHLWIPPLYLDDPNSATPISSPLKNIEYIVTRKSNTCFIRDTVRIIIREPEANFGLSATLACKGVSLQVDSFGILPGRWFVNGLERTFDELVTEKLPFKTEHFVTLIVNDVRCTDTLEKSISMIDTDTLDFIPNVFTPNEDLLNDCYQIGNINLKMECNRLIIYNRWGTPLYDSRTDASCWDGKWNGTDAPEGVYYYILEHKNKIHHGTISLKRN